MNWNGFRAYAQGGGCAARDRVTMRRQVSGPMARLSPIAGGSWTSAVRQPAGGASNVCSAKVMMHPCPLRLAATDSASPHAEFLVNLPQHERAGALEEFRGSRRPWHHCGLANASCPYSVKILTYYLGSWLCRLAVPEQNAPETSTPDRSNDSTGGVACNGFSRRREGRRSMIGVSGAAVVVRVLVQMVCRKRKIQILGGRQAVTILSSFGSGNLKSRHGHRGSESKSFLLLSQ
jgi:hypothetical protein